MSFLTSKYFLVLAVACSGLYITWKDITGAFANMIVQLAGQLMFFMGYEIAKTGSNFWFIHFNLTATIPVIIAFFIIHHFVDGEVHKIVLFAPIFLIALIAWNLLGLLLIHTAINYLNADLGYATILVGILDPLEAPLSPAVTLTAVLVAGFVLFKKILPS